jgi:hypothetical protein
MKPLFGVVIVIGLGPESAQVPLGPPRRSFARGRHKTSCLPAKITAPALLKEGV